MPRAGQKTRRRAIGCGLVAALLAAVVWLSWPRERLLLDMAHPVCRIDTRKTGRVFPKEAVYWLTSDRLLIITTEREGSNGISAWKGHAELYDTTTHSRTDLAGLTNLINRQVTRQGISYGGRPLGFHLSPLGNRLYWWAIRKSSAGKMWLGAAIATLDGTELREWQMESWPWFWTDDQHFVEMGWDRRDQLLQLSIHDTPNPHGDRTIKPSSAQATSILSNYDQNHPLRTRIDVSDRFRPQITRSWFDVRSGQILNRRDIVTLPKNAQVVWHGGNRSTTVGFALYRSETPLISTWIHRFIPSLSVKPVVTEGLWVSRPNVQEMLEIGHIRLRTDVGNDIEGDHIEQVLWLPDGNQLSFTYRGMLYVVPVKTSE